MLTKNLSKIYLLMLFLLGGVAVFLAYSITNDVNPVQAAYAGKKDRNNNPATCRTQGTSCSDRAEFVDVDPGRVGENQMLYCRNLTTAEDDGWSYGTWEVDSVGRCYPNLCDNPENAGWQPGGKNTSCGNPYRCPEPEPTPTEPPPPTVGRAYVQVEAYCDGDIRLDGISFNVRRGGQAVPNCSTAGCEGFTGTRPRVDFDGTENVDIFMASLPSYITSQYPNITPKAARGYNNVGVKNTYRFDYANCGTTPTEPPPPTRSVRCESLTVANPAELREGGRPVFNARTQGNSGGAYSYKIVLENGNRSYTTESSTTQCNGNGSCNSSLGPVPALTTTNGTYNARVVPLSGSLTAGTSCTYSFNLNNNVQPSVSIQKTFTSDIRPVGSVVNFNIRIENTGNVDIRNFSLSDNYDSRYLRFESASYRGQNMVPSTHSAPGADFRRVLTWNNLPVLTTTGSDKVFNLSLTFTSLLPTNNNLVNEDRNCGVVNTIEYKDQTNNDRVDTVNLNSCADFSSNPTDIKAQITKDNISGNLVRTGQDMKFSVRIRNTSDYTYRNVDFIDRYDANHLTVKSVRVSKGDKYVVLTTFASRNPLTINALQDLKDQNGNALGQLLKGEEFVLELTFTAGAPVNNTCDTAVANIRDENGKEIGVTDDACAPITPTTPPNTGASMFLNLVMPALVAGGTLITKRYVIAG